MTPRRGIVPFALAALACAVMVTSGCGGSDERLDRVLTVDGFWQLIAETQRADPREHCDVLAETLSKQPVEAIHVFGYWWDTALEEAYTEDMWGAAYMIGGGASDDGFELFRSWLVLQGRDVFRSAVRDPDSLASIADDPDDDYQSIDCVPSISAWEVATGRDGAASRDAVDAFFDDQERTLLRLGVERIPSPIGDGAPTGEPWDFDDEAEARRRLPRLSERLFG